MNHTSTPTPPQPQSFKGSCHCGAVQFRVWVEKFVAIDCNCSMCQKKGFLHLIVPPDHFELLEGENHLSTYTFNTGIAKHLFCRTCGMHPFYRPRSHPDQFDVNLRCIDDIPLEILLQQFEIQPFDGRHWEQNISQIAPSSNLLLIGILGIFSHLSHIVL